jgi:hypothetical protein
MCLPLCCVYIPLNMFVLLIIFIAGLIIYLNLWSSTKQIRKWSTLNKHIKYYNLSTNDILLMDVLIKIYMLIRQEQT